MRKRLNTTQEMDESNLLKKLIKQLQVVQAMVNVVATHGVGTDEFRRVFDVQEAQCRLPPEVVVEHPAHIKWARHSMNIGDTADIQQWIERTSSSSLRRNGVARVEEQRARAT